MLTKRSFSRFALGATLLAGSLLPAFASAHDYRDDCDEYDRPMERFHRDWRAYDNRYDYGRYYERRYYAPRYYQPAYGYAYPGAREGVTIIYRGGW